MLLCQWRRAMVSRDSPPGSREDRRRARPAHERRSFRLASVARQSSARDRPEHLRAEASVPSPIPHTFPPAEQRRQLQSGRPRRRRASRDRCPYERHSPSGGIRPTRSAQGLGRVEHGKARGSARAKLRVIQSVAGEALFAKPLGRNHRPDFAHRDLSHGFISFHRPKLAARNPAIGGTLAIPRSAGCRRDWVRRTARSSRGSLLWQERPIKQGEPCSIPRRRPAPLTQTGADAGTTLANAARATCSFWRRGAVWLPGCSRWARAFCSNGSNPPITSTR